MDREKLKTAADISQGNVEYNDKNNHYDGFIMGAQWLMQQPLSERLTDDEKCIVRKLHNRCGIEFYHLRDGLERIFGSDLFREK